MAAKATAYSTDPEGIPQGSNNPLVITFDEDVEVSSMTISLWSRGTRMTSGLLKLWTIDDVTIEGNSIICPLEEQETADFPAGNLSLEVKGLDEDGNTVFWEQANVRVLARRDKEFQITGDEG